MRWLPSSLHSTQSHYMSSQSEFAKASMHPCLPISHQQSVAWLLLCSIKTQINDQQSIKFYRHQKSTSALPVSYKLKCSRKNLLTPYCTTRMYSSNLRWSRQIKRQKLMLRKRKRSRLKKCRNSRKDLQRCRSSNSSSILLRATWRCIRTQVYSMNNILSTCSTWLKKKTPNRPQLLPSTNHLPQFQRLKIAMMKNTSHLKLQLILEEGTIMKRISSSRELTKQIWLTSPAVTLQNSRLTCQNNTVTRLSIKGMR